MAVSGNDFTNSSDKLIKDPLSFFKQNQHENAELEFKASYRYDLAMGLCPLQANTENIILNDALEWIIIKTIIAFANSRGGLLIMGVAEHDGALIDQAQCHNCPGQKEKPPKPPCLVAQQKNSPFMQIGDLVITGLDHELTIKNWNFDQLQRHIQSRISPKPGKPITFSPTIYPCTPGKKAKSTTRVFFSRPVDQYIHDIVPVTIENNGETRTLGAISVQPADNPIYLTIEESGSNTILQALPVRKTGRTELENNLQRIETFLSNRFHSAQIKEIISQLMAEIKNTPDQTELTIDEAAEKWRSDDFPYDFIESFGKNIKAETSQLADRPEPVSEITQAFLLLTSLHFNSGWEKWTRLTSSNPLAINALFTTFPSTYWRTRFRAFYALQYMDQALISKELAKEKHQSLTDNTKQILTNHVPNHTVVSFLKEVAASNNDIIASKARAVLSEIAIIWYDASTGMESPL